MFLSYRLSVVVYITLGTDFNDPKIEKQAGIMTRFRR
jgi:hypothetical protein